MSRSIVRFDNAIKSNATRKLYNFYFSKFLEFSKIKDADGLLKLKDSHLQEMLEEYLFDLKKRVNPNSIPIIFAGLELFFTMNDKTINFKKLRKMFPEKIKLSGRDIWQTDDIQKLLKNIKVRRTRAMIHMMASTACRVGALAELQMKHLKDHELGCKSIIFYEGTREEYLGFLTPEASKELDEYFEERIKAGEKFSPDSPVFRSRFFIGIAKAKPMNTNTLAHNLYRDIHRLTNREKVGVRYNIQPEHGFRKRYATICKSNVQANVSLVEKLLGHKGLVQLDDPYFRPSVQTLFAEFKKHMANLTISDEERLRVENLQLENKLQTQEDHEKSMAKLRKDFEKSHGLVIAMARLMQGVGINLKKDDGSNYADDKMTDEYEKMYEEGRNFFKAPDGNRL